MNPTNVQREYKTQPSDLTGVPVSDNRRNRTGNAVPIRKRSKKQENTDNNPFHETMDENFSKQYTNPVNSNINRVERTYAPASENQYRTRNVPQVRKRVKHKEKKASKAEIKIARLKLTAINGWIISWVIFWYLAIQLPFAMLSAVGLGMAYTVYQTINNILGERTANYVVSGMLNTGEKMSSVISYLAKTIFQLPFDPMLIFITPFALIFLLNIFQLLITWFIYNLAGIKALSGNRGGLKNIMFIIAGVGCIAPILNMFPLILLWIIFVWKYPK
jgi:hypothetical protein